MFAFHWSWNAYNAAAWLVWLLAKADHFTFELFSSEISIKHPTIVPGWFS
jgi:hypothetical protein